MTAPDHNQAQMTKDLIDQVVKALVAENGLFRDDVNRIKRLVGEAAGTLRHRFKDIDGIVKNLGDDTTADSLSYQAAYTEIISTLQFEDIVAQIIGHQMERYEIVLTILLQTEDNLRNWEDEENMEEVLAGMREQVDTFLTRLSASDSVKQQSLAVGETELF
ncbi:MAG: hypothetical protein JJ956_13475 [Pseudomonadales bacterium]|nr:hypothetical protein [Pseudomonadales bacterium]